MGRKPAGPHADRVSSSRLEIVADNDRVDMILTDSFIRRVFKNDAKILRNDFNEL